MIQIELLMFFPDINYSLNIRNYSASSKSGSQMGNEGINLKIGSNPSDTKEVRAMSQFEIQV